jgi:uncharacterized protein (DUF433 family)
MSDLTATNESSAALEGIVWTDSERMGGQPCFYGTRVPVRILFDYIEGGDLLEEFLEGFPPVTREQAVAVLEAAKAHLLQELMIEPGEIRIVDAEPEQPSEVQWDFLRALGRNAEPGQLPNAAEEHDQDPYRKS